MNGNVTNCPSCASNNITLDISLGKLKCNHCGYVFENINIDDNLESQQIENTSTNINNDANENTKVNTNNISAGAEDITVQKENTVNYKCKICGSVFLTGENNHSPKCHVCKRIMNSDEKVTCDNSVEYMIPFKISKEVALKNIKEHINKYKLNKKYDYENLINSDSLVAVYLPYTFFDTSYNCEFGGKGERAIDSHYNDKTTTYKVEEYNIVRTFDMDVKFISLDEKTDDITNKDDAYANIISALKPFDISSYTEINGAFLNDSVAELRPLKIPELNEKIINKLTNIAKYGALDSISFYDRGVCWSKTDITVKSSNCYYMYIPVWLYLYTEVNNGKTNYYYFAVNARTGEVANHIPFNKIKAFFKALIIPIIVSLVISSIYILGLIFTLNNDSVEHGTLIPFGIFCGLFFVIIVAYILIIGTRREYEIIKGRILGNHEINENDSKAIYTVSNVNGQNDLVRKYSTTSSTIPKINDNSEEKRRKQFMKKHNVKIIKR